VYVNKVDITKNLNVTVDITFTGTLYDANGEYTSGTTYDDATRLDYEFLTEPVKDTDTIENIQELTFTQDLNIQRT